MNDNFIIFFDIRNFTSWFNSDDGTENAVLFVVEELYKDIGESFAYTKFLGDGAMAILPSDANSAEDVEREIEGLLDTIFEIIDRFEKRKEQTEIKYATNCDLLKIGVGITRDTRLLEVKRYDGSTLPEYVGSRINLSARLCSLARPHGIVIHKPSCNVLPAKYQNQFISRQTGKISGFKEKKVWVSSSVNFVEAAEAHVSGLLIHNKKVLLAKRPSIKDTKIYPNFWAGPGGRVRLSMSFEDSLKVIFREETGAYVNNLKIINTYFNKEHQFPGLLYMCKLDTGGIKETETMRFFSQDEIQELHLIPDLKETLFNLFERENL